MTKEHKEYNPLKPLKNRKHEAIAKKVASDPQIEQTIAYKEQYPNVSPESLPAAASRLLNSVNVRERVMALLSASAKRPILEAVSDKINEHMNGDNAPVSMDACKTVLKVSGAMDEAKADAQSFNPIQINFIVHAPQSATPIIEATDVQAS